MNHATHNGPIGSWHQVLLLSPKTSALDLFPFKLSRTVPTCHKNPHYSQFHPRYEDPLLSTTGWRGSASGAVPTAPRLVSGRCWHPALALKPRPQQSKLPYVRVPKDAKFEVLPTGFCGVDALATVQGLLEVGARCAKDDMYVWWYTYNCNIIYIYIYIYIHAPTHTHIYIYTYTNTYVCIYIHSMHVCLWL